MTNWLNQKIRRMAKHISRIVHPSHVYGSAYRNTLKSLANEEFQSSEELEQFECQKIRELYSRISRSTDFYSRLPQFSAGWESRNPKEILMELPLVSKEMMQDNCERFTVEDIPVHRREYVTTGGSTAEPMGFFEVKRISRAIESAYIHHIWSQVGYTPTSRSAVFRGGVVAKNSGDRLWIYEPFQRALVLSSYHLQGKTLERIFSKLQEFNPLFIQAYPSSANLLAAHIEESGAKPPENLKALLLGSETLPKWQRKRISSAFGAPVYSWYGHAEKAALAFENGDSDELHIFPSYGYVYLRGEGGTIITGLGVPGEIIATGFTNLATQFVNYRTGDIGVWASGAPRKIGNTFMRTLARVEGRAQEFAITSSGCKISMSNMNMHGDIFDAVKQFRFVQDTRGKIKMEIVRKSDFSIEDAQKISRGVGEKLGEDMTLELSYVDSLPRARSGKGRWMEQKLKV